MKHEQWYIMNIKEQENLYQATGKIVPDISLIFTPEQMATRTNCQSERISK